MSLSFIKLDINIMDDTKIKIIRKMPDGSKLFELWIGILCLGMKSGHVGVLMVGDGIPFTAEMLADNIDIPLPVVKMGLSTFIQLRMIEICDNGTILILNFEKHQALTRIILGNENARLRMQKHRAKQRLLIGKKETPVTRSLREPLRPVTEIDEDEDKDKDREKTVTPLRVTINPSLEEVKSYFAEMHFQNAESEAIKFHFKYIDRKWRHETEWTSEAHIWNQRTIAFSKTTPATDAIPYGKLP